MKNKNETRNLLHNFVILIQKINLIKLSKLLQLITDKNFMIRLE